MMAQSKIVWQAPDFEYRPKSIAWYWTSIVLMSVFLGAAVWQRNFLLAFFVVIAEILILVWASRKPTTFAFKLSGAGLEIVGQKLFPLTDIQSFSIDEETSDQWAELTLRFQRRLKASLVVNLPKDQSALIHNLLGAHLTEVEPESSLLETLERLLGF